MLDFYYDNIFEGLYTCFVSNEIGDGECVLDVTEDVLRGGVLDLIIIFIISIIIAMVVVVLLAIVCYLCYRNTKRSDDKGIILVNQEIQLINRKNLGDIKKDSSKSQLLKDDQIHADPEFYENLPFNKLRNPPKNVSFTFQIERSICSCNIIPWSFQVLDDESDVLDYADCDYLDIYANGPLKYREASEKNATMRKKKLEERKAVKSAYL